jgi:glycosyltransferase involved in cell wall biosynthesis
MSDAVQSSGGPHLIWVYNAPVATTLAATSRLEVTNELRKMGWRVTLVAEGLAGRQEVRGVEVLCIPKPDIYLLGHCLFQLRLLALLAHEWSSTDVVLFHQMSAPALLLLGLVRRLVHARVPLFVMDTRDVDVIAASRRDAVRVGYYKLAHRLANRWADGQTAITPRMAGWLGIPSEQLWGTWPSGVSIDSFLPARAARRWPATGEPIRLIYVGALLPERNLLSLCRAVERANTSQMAFELTIAGDGRELNALEQLTSGRQSWLCVVPPMPHRQIPSLLAEAHVGVVSLADPDDRKLQASSPIKLFEYMAAGLPILITRNACYTDVVGTEEFAFCAQDPSVEELCAALRLVWQARASLDKMGSKAAAAVRAWTWRESAKKLSEALERGIAAYHDGCGRR